MGMVSTVVARYVFERYASVVSDIEALELPAE
jgi:hypothetical protein